MKRAAILVLLVAAACSSGDPSGADSPEWQGDEAAYEACDVMAGYANDGQPADVRQATLTEVNDQAEQSTTPQVVDQAAALAASVDTPSYQLAADVFSATCLDLGYAEAQN